MCCLEIPTFYERKLGDNNNIFFEYFDKIILLCFNTVANKKVKYCDDIHINILWRYLLNYLNRKSPAKSLNMNHDITAINKNVV